MICLKKALLLFKFLIINFFLSHSVCKYMNAKTCVHGLFFWFDKRWLQYIKDTIRSITTIYKSMNNLINKKYYLLIKFIFQGRIFTLFLSL